MGDRHGGRFARRGRALNPSRPQVDAHRGVGLRWREGERICPHARTRPSAKASRHGARAKEFAPRRNTPRGEGLPTRREGERICAAQEHAPRRRSPDTARRRKNLPRAGIRPAAKASRHGARAKGFVPRRNAPHGEGLPTRRTGERICPTQERSPRRRPTDTAHERKDLPAQERSPRRRPPDTAHGRKDLPRAETLSSAKASRHDARAKGFAPRGSRSPHVPTNGGPPSTDGQPEKHPFGEVAPETARPLPSSFTEKNKTTP